MGSCRSRERGGRRPCALTRKENLGKGVRDVGLGRRQASSFYISTPSSHGLAWRPTGGRSPRVWGLHQSKARLSRAPPHPRLRGKLIPTTGLSGLCHSAWEAGEAQVPPLCPPPTPSETRLVGSSPWEGMGLAEAQTRGGTASSTTGGFRSVCAQPCARESGGREGQTRFVVSSVVCRRRHVSPCSGSRTLCSPLPDPRAG